MDGTYGGGVYFWNDDVSLTADKLGGLTIDGNRGEQGGGVYLDEENNTLKNLIIMNNSANDIGGGIYTYNDYTIIDNCTITGNSKYGVYIDGDCDKGMQVKGATVIRDNYDGNLTLENGSAFMTNSDLSTFQSVISWDMRQPHHATTRSTLWRLSR
jgi:hypothetical protein